MRTRAIDDAQQVALSHDDEFFAVEHHLGPRPLAEKDPVAVFDIQ
jgi:hypothetical protein